MDRRDTNPTNHQNATPPDRSQGPDMERDATSHSRVLIVTTSRVERDTLAGQLSAFVREVVSVENVPDAKSRLQAERFDLVLISVGDDFEPA